MVTPEEIEAAKKKFGLDKISKPIFGLNPGAEYGPAKRWPVEQFIAAAKEIQQRTNCVWILFGGKGDQPLTAQIESAIRNPQSAIINLAGKTSLRELMALAETLPRFAHQRHRPDARRRRARHAGRRAFGSTSPELTGPGLPGDARNHLLKSDAPCSPCFLRECPIDFRCMNGISVERVVQALVESLNG